jgi:hypothetical protein
VIMSMNLIVKFKDMKYILLATLLCGMFSSCTENLSGQRHCEVSEESLPFGIREFSWKGHNYLKASRVLIHSESCKCKEAKK